MVTGRIAYANARIRSLKSQLYDAGVRRRMRTTGTGPPLHDNGGGAGESGATESGADWVQQRWHHLVRCYTVVLRSYPSGQRLVRALLTLHEIENVKLLWRARTRSHPFERWRVFWRPLGALETVRLEDCRDLTSLTALAAALRRTPYGALAATTVRAHANDLAASELAFDRWASASLMTSAVDLGRAETAARDLVLAIVRERDLNLLRRGVSSFGLSPDAVVGSLVLLPREVATGELARLAAWSPREGSLLRAWPKAWRAGPDLPADWDALLVALRRARRRACQRAFLGYPFCLAPAIALLLFQEEEVRGLVSLREAAGRADVDQAIDRALAASALGM
jgi:vacuolar-type H+-ATPase subunit C/Vma6